MPAHGTVKGLQRAVIPTIILWPQAFPYPSTTIWKLDACCAMFWHVNLYLEVPRNSNVDHCLKSLLNLLQYYFCFMLYVGFFFFFFWSWDIWNLSSLTRNRIHTPCIGKWSLTYWTTREVPRNSKRCLEINSFPINQIKTLSCFDFVVVVFKHKQTFLPGRCNSNC